MMSAARRINHDPANPARSPPSNATLGFGSVLARKKNTGQAQIQARITATVARLRLMGSVGAAVIMAALVALAASSVPARAQQYQVVASCDSISNPGAVGTGMQGYMDTAGRICTTGGGTSSSSGSATFRCTGTITLPAGGGTYTTVSRTYGTMVSATPTVAVTCANAAATAGGTVIIAGATMKTTTQSITPGSFSLKVYSATPTLTGTPGNDSDFGPAVSTASRVCTIPIALSELGPNGASGDGAPNAVNACVLKPATTSIFLLLAATSAYVWGAAEVITIEVFGFN